MTPRIGCYVSHRITFSSSSKVDHLFLWVTRRLVGGNTVLHGDSSVREVLACLWVFGLGLERRLVFLKIRSESGDAESLLDHEMPLSKMLRFACFLFGVWESAPMCAGGFTKSNAPNEKAGYFLSPASILQENFEDSFDQIIVIYSSISFIIF